MKMLIFILILLFSLLFNQQTQAVEVEGIVLKKKSSIEEKTKIDFSGYLQVRYVADETISKSDGFKIQRARLDFQGDVSKDIGWRLQVDTVQPILLDAYLDYKPSPFTNFRVGQFKPPFGWENLESSSKLDTINRSQVTQNLAPKRDIGGQIKGGFGTKKKVLEYMVGVFNGAGINVDDNNEYKDVVYRLLVFPTQGLSIGIAYYNGRSGIVEIDKIRTGGEIIYTINKLSLKAEYISGKDSLTNKYGWYGQVGYKITPKLEPVVKYDRYDPDEDKANDRIDVATFGLNWFINKWTKIQANYEWKMEESVDIRNNNLIFQFQVKF